MLLTQILILSMLLCAPEQKNQTSAITATSYADSVFLAIEGDLLANPDLIWGNIKTWEAALYRLEQKLTIKNNQFQWDIKNGAEIKISENIFDYITTDWKQDNERLMSGEYDIMQEIEKGHYFTMRKNANKPEFEIKKITDKKAIPEKQPASQKK